MALPDYNSNTSSVNEAMSEYTKLEKENQSEIINSPCNTQLRSGPFDLLNQSQWDVEIMFMQLKSNLKPLPGYISDTGVFVAAKNVRSGASDTIDPCIAGGRNQPIQATWMQYNAKMTIVVNGKKHESVIEKTISPSSGTIRQGIIRIVQSSNLIGAEIQLVEFDDQDIMEKRCTSPGTNCPDV